MPDGLFVRLIVREKMSNGFYIGLRKNLFDLRRVAVVHNLHVIARMDQVLLS
jgi:hypothetical protein